MKPLPTDPYAFQARVMDALLGDIADPSATAFPRLDALHATLNEQPREAGDSKKAPASNS